MFLKKIELLNFKNYEEASLTFDPHVNCFTGSNGGGKTNLLEAIHYMAMTKGYFSTTDAQNLRHDASMFHIQAEFVTERGLDTVSCTLRSGQKKQFLVNKTEYDRLGEHIGRFPVVVICPNDHIIITGGSDVRRRFIDGIISQVDKSYLFTLMSYNQALLQRNALLKKVAVSGFMDAGTIDLWNERLVELAGPVYEKRTAFINEFQPLFNASFNFICGGTESTDLQYQSSLSDEDFKAALEKNLKKDIELRYTTLGIHKDDLQIFINGYPVKRYASQGQQKSVTIALKLAQFEYLSKIGYSKPMVLLDDVFDKLDDNRVSRLMELVSQDRFGQLFVTDTSETKLSSVFQKVQVKHKIFHVSDGKVLQTEQQLHEL